MNKKWALLIGLVILIVIGAIIYRNSQFRIVSIVPDNNGIVATSTGTIEVRFNKDLAEGIDYTQTLSGDAATVESIRVSGKLLSVQLRQLTENNRYAFSIVNIKSKSGEVIDNVPFDMTARYIPESQLSKDQLRLQISETDRGNADDPILQFLPYGGLHFNLTSNGEIAGGDEPGTLLQAELFLSKADLSDKNTAQRQYQQGVLDYISSLGLNPDDYVIRYTITESSAF